MRERVLEGKIAIVTGAASPRGLGRAMTEALVKAGARVSMMDINQQWLDETQRSLSVGCFRASSRPPLVSKNSLIEPLQPSLESPQNKFHLANYSEIQEGLSFPQPLDPNRTTIGSRQSVEHLSFMKSCKLNQNLFTHT